MSDHEIDELYEDQSLYDDLLPDELKEALDSDLTSIDQWFVW